MMATLRTSVAAWQDLRTNPLSGQASTIFLLRHPRPLACHSGAALDPNERESRLRRDYSKAKHMNKRQLQKWHKVLVKFTELHKSTLEVFLSKKCTT